MFISKENNRPDQPTRSKAIISWPTAWSTHSHYQDVAAAAAVAAAVAAAAVVAVVAVVAAAVVAAAVVAADVATADVDIVDADTVAAVAVGEAAADGGGAVVVAAVKEQEKMARVVPVPNCARWFQSDRNDRLDAWHPAARLIDLGEHVE